jgi:hypothetical protein
MLYNIVDYGESITIVLIIKIRLNEIYSKDRSGKHLSDAFPTHNEMLYCHCFSNFH